jgi:hypothetical protein
MEREGVERHLNDALQKLMENDRYLLEVDVSERCIASRLAFYLQNEFPEYLVDVEYNRDGDVPKRLGLPEECANYRDNNGQALAVPDVIVHRRGRDSPNLLVLELKKTTNPDPRDCDRARVRALRKQLGYSFGALIECETRQGRRPPGATVSEWLGE